MEVIMSADKVFNKIENGKTEEVREMVSQNSDLLLNRKIVNVAIPVNEEERKENYHRHNLKYTPLDSEPRTLENDKRTDCPTPLHHAIKNGKIEIVEMLLEEGKRQGKLGEMLKAQLDGQTPSQLSLTEKQYRVSNMINNASKGLGGPDQTQRS
jgi:hypothetical protein